MTLKKAGVESIQVFARDWHGWMYYPSEKFPESIHPGLVRPDLLGEQMAVLRAHDIRPVIYTSGQVDRNMADRRLDWVQQDPTRPQGGAALLEPGFGPPLCLNTAFRDYVLGHVEELLRMYEVPGFWLDAASPQNCLCYACRTQMREQGLDPAHDGERQEFGLAVLEAFQKDFKALVDAHQPDATVFFNRGHLNKVERRVGKYFTHFEIESLGSSPGWGYMHYPVSVRYARTLKREIVAMTGKFQTSWGDFHSFKNPAALEFESFQALAHGAKVSIGDQLHPTGRVCEETYKLIGHVFRQIEQKEPWCADARAVTELAVLSPEPFLKAGCDHPPSLTGATRMLQELALQFDVVDDEADFGHYPMLVLPEEVEVDEALEQKLRGYLQDGGKMLLTGSARSFSQKFREEILGLKHVAAPEFSTDYIVPEGLLGEGLAFTEHHMYLAADVIEPLDRAQVLASARDPWFQRTWRHFCSHCQAPAKPGTDRPAAVRQGNVVYLAHPVFTAYRHHAPHWCKAIFRNALCNVLGLKPLLRHNGPSSLVATLMRQEQEQRYVLHFLHYIPERRADFDIIEDAIPLHDISIGLNLACKKVSLVPDGAELMLDSADDDMQFTIPKIVGHQMVEIQ